MSLALDALSYLPRPLKVKGVFGELAAPSNVREGTARPGGTYDEYRSHLEVSVWSPVQSGL